MTSKPQLETLVFDKYLCHLKSALIFHGSNCPLFISKFIIAYFFIVNTFSFSVFFKGLLLLGGLLFWGGPLLSGLNRKGKKFNVAFGEPLFSEGPLLSEFYGTCT